METTLFFNLINDNDFFNLKKLKYKYSEKEVSNCIDILKSTMFREIKLKDFTGNNFVFIPSKVSLNINSVKNLIKPNLTEYNYGFKAMNEEIYSTLEIENIHSERKNIENVLNGYAISGNRDNHIMGIKKGLDFISDNTNKINKENLKTLYNLAIGNYLQRETKLLEGHFYRHDKVFVVGGKEIHEGLAYEKLPEYMDKFIKFIDDKSDIDDFIKSVIIHFYLAYIHPYFDGNGRMARLLHLWFLVQKGYPTSLFVSFSKHINYSKKKYYKAFQIIEENQKMSKVIDVTPFINYFIENVYNKLEFNGNEESIFDIFLEKLNAGEITLKEKELWNFVISHYGKNEFTTKELEKTFGNAAYATIRSFVLKFEGFGLLGSQKYKNRNKYFIK